MHKSKDPLILVEVHSLVGDIYMAQNNFSLAISSYEKVFVCKYDFLSKHYTNLAEAYYEEGEYKKSIKILKNALRKNVNILTLQEKIVDLSIREGNFSLALSLIDKMMKTHVDKARLYEYRALIMKEQGRV